MEVKRYEKTIDLEKKLREGQCREDVLKMKQLKTEEENKHVITKLIVELEYMREVCEQMKASQEGMDEEVQASAGSKAREVELEASELRNQEARKMMEEHNLDLRAQLEALKTRTDSLQSQLKHLNTEKEVSKELLEDQKIKLEYLKEVAAEAKAAYNIILKKAMEDAVTFQTKVAELEAADRRSQEEKAELEQHRIILMLELEGVHVQESSLKSKLTTTEAEVESEKLKLKSLEMDLLKLQEVVRITSWLEDRRLLLLWDSWKNSDCGWLVVEKGWSGEEQLAGSRFHIRDFALHRKNDGDEDLLDGRCQVNVEQTKEVGQIDIMEVDEEKFRENVEDMVKVVNKELDQKQVVKTDDLGKNLKEKVCRNVVDIMPYWNSSLRVKVERMGAIRMIKKRDFCGTVLECTLADSSGQVKLSAFSQEGEEHVNQMQEKLCEGSVYIISGASVQPVKDYRFNSTGHFYELVWGVNTTLEGPLEGEDIVLLYKLQPLSKVAESEPGCLLDVLGVVSDVGPCTLVLTNKTNKHLQMRKVKIEDSSGSAILDLWGTKATGFTTLCGKVLAVRRGQVQLHEGKKSLSFMFTGSLEVEPSSVKEVSQLVSWARQKQLALTTEKQKQPEGMDCDETEDEKLESVKELPAYNNKRAREEDGSKVEIQTFPNLDHQVSGYKKT